MADPGEGTGGPAPSLFLDQTEAQKAEKNFFETIPPPPHLISRVGSGTVLSLCIDNVWRKLMLVTLETSVPLCLVILIGVSIDLVCLAEQPLHTVPLLKYISKVLSQGDANLGDDFNIPHWMNHGFYTSPERRNKKENFVPRIKVPDVVLSSLGRCGGNENGRNMGSMKVSGKLPTYPSP